MHCKESVTYMSSLVLNNKYAYFISLNKNTLSFVDLLLLKEKDQSLQLFIGQHKFGLNKIKYFLFGNIAWISVSINVLNFM